MSDEDLVREIAQGSESAFEEIFTRYRERVYAICYRYTRNYDDAQDLCQEIFIKFFRKAGSFDGRSSFFTWFYRLIVNHCISFKRKEKGLPELPRKPTPDLELKMAINRAVSSLPPRQRIVFIMRQDGYRFKEIGKLLGITEGAAKSNYHYAISKLRSDLKEYL
ncbi:MAG TPA: RNA polymerase sigma factor [bacterium (Candidatus Stahlbacteria)]|nr:RNA polymerase sigma factor [Candidatus Stahlbacteria bacterium]